MEERLDVVVDSSSAKRGVDVLVSAFTNMAGASARAESATSRLFQTMNRGISGLESKLFNIRSIIASFTVVLGGFRQLGNEITRFQAFTSALSVTTGSAKAARVEYDFLMTMADRLGISINALSHNYGQLTAAAAHSGMAIKDVRVIFESFSVAARVMHLSGMDTRLMFYALTQMVSKGVVSMEELRRQLGEKLPGAMNIAAKSLGIGMPELEKAIRAGSVDSAKFLPIFAESVKETFSPGLTNAVKAFDAEVNRLINNLQKMVLIFFDLGVADSFTLIIKELNRVLSDKSVAESFGKAIKSISEGIADFLKTINGESVNSFVAQFSSAMKTIGTTITEDVLPVIQKLLANVKEIVIGWATIKGMAVGGQLGAQLGGGKGAAIGALVGGAAGGFGSNFIMNQLGIGSDKGGPGVPPRDWRAALSSHMGAARERAALLGLNSLGDELAAGAPRRQASLADVTNNSGKRNAKFEEASLRLRKEAVEAESEKNLFITTQLDIQAGKYGVLTKLQEQHLLTLAATAEQEKSLAALRKETDPQKVYEASAKRESELKEQSFQRMEELRTHFMTEEELFNQSFTRKAEIIHENARLVGGYTSEHLGLLLSLEQEYYNQSLEFQRKKMTEQQRIDAMGYRQKAATIFGALTSMTAGVAQHSKKMFELNKLAAIAHAALTLPETVMDAYKWGNKFGGPPLGVAFAAIAGAAQLTQIAAIKKASFNGGGAGSAPSLAGSTPAQAVSPVTGGLADPVFGGADQTRREFHVEIRGSAIHRPILEEIAAGLSELTKDGFPVIFTVPTHA